MIKIEEAVNSIINHVSRFGNLLPSQEPRLEEFNYDSEDEIWTITMSFEDPTSYNRSYRVFTIDEDGAIKSMRLRLPAGSEDF